MSDPPSTTDWTPETLAADYETAAATIASDPDDIDALSALVMAGTRLGGAAAMLPEIERLEKLMPDRPDLAVVAGQTRFSLGLAEAAIATAERVVGNAPSDLVMQARTLIAQSLLKLGRIEECDRLCADLIRRGFGATAIRILAQVDLARGDRDRAIARLRPMARNPTISSRNRLSLGYDLAKALDKCGEYDEAFAVATEMGELGDYDFDRTSFESETDAIIEAFSAERYADLARSSSTDERPVFIVGMPRSGTTLLEQIIDAHPDAVGIGERGELEMAAHLLGHRTGKPFPTAMASATPAMLDEIADLYLRMVEDLSHRLAPTPSGDGAPRRAVNKFLNLDRLMGLIARALPGARMIVLRRNPLDNLVSILLNPFAVTNSWTGSLEGIIAARRRFDRLVAHWKATLDIPVLDLAYEDLASEPETHIREVLEFLELPFDERCLSFHATGRVVMTPSAEQVNKPMNTAAIARWRRYEKHLGPAIEAFPDAAG